MSNRLNMSQQCAPTAMKANSRPGWICKCTTSRLRVPSSVFSSSETAPWVLCPVWASQCMKDMNIQVQQRIVKMVRGLKSDV